MARFDYEAPAEGTAEAAAMRTGPSTVDLMSISRRGIGRKELDYGLQQCAVRVRLDHEIRLSQSGVSFRLDAGGETLHPLTFTSAMEFEGEADLLETRTGQSSMDAGVLKMQLT